MTKIAEVFAENLRRIRKERELTQAQLAEAIDISLASIQNYESQRIWPSIETVEALAKALHVPEAELFRDPNYKEPPEVGFKEIAQAFVNAHPIAIEHALKILREIGQPHEEQPVAARPRRTAKS